MGIYSVLDLLHPLPAALRRPDERRSDIGALVPGDGGVVSATVQRAPRPAAPAGPQAIVEVKSTTAPASSRDQFFNQPWRTKQLAAGSRGRRCSARSTVYRSAAADGEPRRRGHRLGEAARPVGSCRSTPVREGGHLLDRSSASSSTRRCSAQASSPTRSPSASASGSGLVSRTEAFPPVHEPDDRRRRPDSPGAGSPSTSSSAFRSPSSCASGPRRPTPVASATTSMATRAGHPPRRGLPRRACRSSSPRRSVA